MIAEKHKLSYSFLRPQEARLAVCSCHCIALTDVPDVVKLDTNFQASLRVIYTACHFCVLPTLTQGPVSVSDCRPSMYQYVITLVSKQA